VGPPVASSAVGATELLLVRHGESVGNVAYRAAYASNSRVIDLDGRDADIELSDLGIQQAQALGRRLGDLDGPAAPQAVWCSTHTRARQTARIALDTAGSDLAVRLDERLRDREAGVLDRLTARGVHELFPEEARRRDQVGKFFHRPAGGESWADLALRVRSVLRDIDTDDAGRRVLVVAHDAVVLVFRYVCERLDEAEVMRIRRSVSVANASVTRLVRPSGEGPWELSYFNAVEHLDDCRDRTE